MQSVTQSWSFYLSVCLSDIQSVRQAVILSVRLSETLLSASQSVSQPAQVSSHFYISQLVNQSCSSSFSLSPPQRPPTVAPWENIIAARGGWEEEKLKRAVNAGKSSEIGRHFENIIWQRLPPFPSSHRSPRSRFLSPALPLPFLSLVFTNRSLCGGESHLVSHLKVVSP